MSPTHRSPKSLPPNPSEEYLRKEAKRLSRNGAMLLSAAQLQLAHDYGYRNWAELMTDVQTKASGGGAGGDDPSQPGGSTPTRESEAKVLPLLPLRGLVAFPHVSYPNLCRATDIHPGSTIRERTTDSAPPGCAEGPRAIEPVAFRYV